MRNYNHEQWALSLALEIDRVAAGFCGAFLRASNEKRQVIAAYMSARPPVENEHERVATFLLKANHRTILEAAYRERTQGLRGALRRSGPIVREERFYRLIQKMLSKPPHSMMIRCIQGLTNIDLDKLRIAAILPQPICRANVVEALPNVATASNLVEACRLLVAAGIAESELHARIRELRRESEVAELFNRMLLKCEAPPHPVPATENYLPITSAAALHSLAKRFRNCARSYSVELLDPSAGHAFAEVRLGREAAVVHLERKRGKWQVEDLLGHRNGPVSRVLREHMLAYLASHGIEYPTRGRSKTAWEPIRRLTARNIFDLDFT